MILKFRAWHKEEKRWIGKYFGFIVHFDSNGSVNYITEFDERRQEWRLSPEKFILLLSTEKFDKKGVEKFKGDIVKSGNGRLWVIKHGEYTVDMGRAGTLPLNGFYIESIEGGKCILPLRPDSKEDEIIGNKFENPELLK